VQDIIDHPGDLDILDCDSGQIHDRNLVLAGAADRGIPDHVAQFKNGTLFDLSGLHRIKTLTVIDAL
jgi:hypothetical protein